MTSPALEASFCIFHSRPTSKYYKSPFLRSYISPNPSPVCPLSIVSNSPQQFIKIPTKKLCSTLEDVKVEQDLEQPQKVNQKRKLFVLNLPWSFSVADIKKLFGECGIVEDVEIIKQKDGKSRGFAFVTMASGQEAQAVIDKFDSSDLSGRVIRVEFAKKFKKPSRSPSPAETLTHHKLYASNLAWKVRSTDLREFFSPNFKPISARVVFDGPSGRSAGYGFVSFATKEEAETAISSLNGKELLGRPIGLKLSERKTNEELAEKV